MGMVPPKRAVRHQQQGHGDVLVGSEWLADHLHDPGLRLVEVDVSPANFDDWHLDGAVLWNVYRDLKDTEYGLADRAAIQRLLERSGIRQDSTLVFYGYAPAMGFWLMKLYGHADVRILDCARTTWQDEGLPRTRRVVTPVPTTYPLGEEDPLVRARVEELERAVGDPRSAIVDVRSEPEFHGERFWPSGGQEPGGRAGHVPTAVNLSIEGAHDERGAFRSEADLQQIFSSVDLSSDDDVITYCTIGGRASTAWFILVYLLHRTNVRVYDGSWAEWGRTAALPVA